MVSEALGRASRGFARHSSDLNVSVRAVEAGCRCCGMLRTSRAPYDTSFLIDSLQELSDDKRDTLNPLHLLLRAQQFSAEVERLISDVFLSVS